MTLRAIAHLISASRFSEPCVSLVAQRVAGTTCLTGSAKAPKLAA